MAKQTFTTGQVLTAAQMTSLQQTAMLGGAASAKTASYTLVAADAGTAISMSNASATTITVNTGLFAAGDTVFIQNIGAGACTITAGTATVATAGSLILPQNDAGILYFTSTGAATFYDFIQAGAVSPLTTKGDLYGFSTLDARIPIGANDTVLTADSTQSLGLKWAAPASGGGMTLLQSLSLTGSSVTSSTLSSAYKQFFILIRNFYGSATTALNMRLNGDTGSNYSYNWWDGTTSIGGASVNAGAQFRVGTQTTDTATLKRFNGIITISRPSDTDVVYVSSDSNVYNTANYSGFVTGVYDNSAAITSITFFVGSGSMTAGTAEIYGVN